MISLFVTSCLQTKWYIPKLCSTCFFSGAMPTPLGWMLSCGRREGYCSSSASWTCWEVYELNVGSFLLYSEIHLNNFYVILQIVSVLPCKSVLQSMSSHPVLLYNGVFYISLMLVLCFFCEWFCPAPRLQFCSQQLTTGEVFLAPSLCIILSHSIPLQCFHILNPFILHFIPAF